MASKYSRANLVGNLTVEASIFDPIDILDPGGHPNSSSDGHFKIPQ
jgi:hypothetical protein